MNSWYAVKNRIKSAFNTIKSTPVLDSTAKTALKSVPYIGDFLLNLYDSSGGSEEERTRKILEILERLEDFHAQQFKQLSNMLAENRESLVRDSQALDNILGKADKTLTLLKSIEDGQIDLKESSDHIIRYEE